MKIINSVSILQKLIKKEKLKKKSIGFVPTMGALHKGHLSLMKKCRRDNDIAIASIFVNPKQFGPNEDFKKYPRQKKNDEIFAKSAKIDIIFYPSEKVMYPTSYLTYVEVEKMGNVLCGRSRPGHFKGVATVVTKLLNIVAPDTLYLGQKDAQQAVIIKKMIKDLNIQTTIKICPTVREKDGLALSSRNKYLSQKQRKEAPILFQSLKMAREKAKRGTNNPTTLCQYIKKNITKHSSGIIDYIECVDADTLEKLKTVKGRVMIALAVKFGEARLIDNIIFSI